MQAVLMVKFKKKNINISHNLTRSKKKRLNEYSNVKAKIKITSLPNDLFIPLSHFCPLWKWDTNWAQNTQGACTKHSMSSIFFGHNLDPKLGGNLETGLRISVYEFFNWYWQRYMQKWMFFSPLTEDLFFSRIESFFVVKLPLIRAKTYFSKKSTQLLFPYVRNELFLYFSSKIQCIPQQKNGSFMDFMSFQ